MALKLPRKYTPPPEIEEAMIAAELCVISYSDLPRLPERLVHDLLVYRAVKTVAEYGGSYEP